MACDAYGDRVGMRSPSVRISLLPKELTAISCYRLCSFCLGTDSVLYISMNVSPRSRLSRVWLPLALREWPLCVACFALGSATAVGFEFVLNNRCTVCAYR